MVFPYKFCSAFKSWWSVRACSLISARSYKKLHSLHKKENELLKANSLKNYTTTCSTHLSFFYISVTNYKSAQTSSVCASVVKASLWIISSRDVLQRGLSQKSILQMFLSHG